MEKSLSFSAISIPAMKIGLCDSVTLISLKELCMSIAVFLILSKEYAFLICSGFLYTVQLPLYTSPFSDFLLPILFSEL